MLRPPAEIVFDKYSRLTERRNKPADVLSGDKRRLLEILRVLVTNPEVLLVDEPSIELEPHFIHMAFEILDDLQNGDGKTFIMVEQNAKKCLSFANICYVLVSRQTTMAGKGDELLLNADVGRLFLGVDSFCNQSSDRNYDVARIWLRITDCESSDSLMCTPSFGPLVIRPPEWNDSTRMRSGIYQSN